MHSSHYLPLQVSYPHYYVMSSTNIFKIPFGTKKYRKKYLSAQVLLPVIFFPAVSCLVLSALHMSPSRRSVRPPPPEADPPVRWPSAGDANPVLSPGSSCKHYAYRKGRGTGHMIEACMYTKIQRISVNPAFPMNSCIVPAFAASLCH